MKLSQYILSVVFLINITSCNNTNTFVSNPNDYNAYLVSNKNTLEEKARKEYAFWNIKLAKAPNQFPYLSKKASANSQLFNTTGNIDYLIAAEEDLIQANKKTNYNNASYLRALARNYISQHRFKEALELLEKAKTNGERLDNTKKMLFDVHLELGNYSTAENYLNSFKSMNDFDYLIRLSKWSDYKGDLDSAIRFMEKALAKAKDANNNNLIQWSYTNLADLYGHANRIEDSYNYYLKALEIDSNDVYAIKGISWILYSHEKKPEEALHILNAISQHYASPEYFLLKAEIAEYINNKKLKKDNIQQYLLAVENKQYGAMYNKYTALLYVEELFSFDEALNIARKEIEERPIPQSYDLLAWTYFNNGEKEKALQIVQNSIFNKTYEPEAQYHMAEIYKANGKEKIAMKLKKDLLESAYELGPLMAKKIAQL